MKDKRNYIYLLLIAVVVIFQLMTSKEAPDIQLNHGGELIVDFIDVGQGDAILITSPDGHTMLIDAGDNSQEEQVVSFLHKKGIKKIDFVIGTHPHADHIGGLDAVIRNFDIGEIYMPKLAHTTKTFEDVLIAIKEKGYTIKTAKAGVSLDLEDTMDVQMLGPISNSYTDINDYSAIVKLKYGAMTFLFTGDAEKTSEYEMIEKGYPLNSVVLKVGHHGSDTSTTDEFLEAVNPKYAVISSGKDNKYGHPHKDIIKKLEDNNIIYFDTQTHGTITAITNGQDIKWITEVKEK